MAIFRKMALLKIHDERFRRLLKTGSVRFSYYSFRGQEAIAAAMSVAMNDDDYICTIYRGIQDSLARGVPLKPLWAELLGREAGTCKGKGGPMHLTYPAAGVMVTTGIVGSSMPIANGLALASQIVGDSRVTVATFGDGASNIGAFHESLNLASVWKLPVIFLCANNGYAEHTRYDAMTSVDLVSKRAASYTMPGVTVDGNDPLAMYAVAKAAVDRARAGEGPTLIEAKTFRFFGHVFGDNDFYMDKAEKAAAMAKDPYVLFRRWLIDAQYADEAELAAIENGVVEAIDEAEAFALDAAYPPLDEIYRDVVGAAA
jgi:pyruvate dehydrogenase E1 component alpha subunit